MSHRLLSLSSTPDIPKVYNCQMINSQTRKSETRVENKKRTTILKVFGKLLKDLTNKRKKADRDLVKSQTSWQHY